MFGRKIVDVQPFVARTSRARMLLVILGSLGFVGLGLWIAGAIGASPDPDSAWVGWVAVIVFGICAVVGVGLLLPPREQLMIDERGILYPRRSREILPWREITEVRVMAVRRQRFLAITLRDPHLYPPSTLLGQIGGLNRALGFGDLAIGTVGTDRRFDELLEAIDLHHPR